MDDASVHPYLDGENMTTVQARVVPALASLLAANVGRRIAVVAHNVVNRVYLTHLMNIPLRNYRAMPQENCGLNLIRCVQGEPTPVTINSVWHLMGP